MIGEIEDKLIEALTAATARSTGAFGYEARIATYAGELSEGLERAVKGFPAILVVFNGKDPIPNKSSARRQVWTYRFMIVCAATSLRNEKASRHGDTHGAVGSYQMIRDVIGLLREQTFDLDDVEPIEAGAVRPLVNDKAGNQLASIYTIDLSMVVHTDHTPDTYGLDDFKEFHVNWDVPPLGNVETPLPNDEAADATDHTHLPQ